MAFLDMTPKISVCIKDGCSKLVISDATLAYNATTNPGGWDAPNLVPEEVFGTIICTYPSGAIVSEDVTAALTANNTTYQTPFELVTLDTTEGDGVYEYTYTLRDGINMISSTVTKFSLCNSRCCIDKLWAKAAVGLTVQDCNCGGGTELYCQKATQAEALYKAIIAAASSGKDLVRDELLKKLQRICSLENCNCN